MKTTDTPPTADPVEDRPRVVKTRAAPVKAGSSKGGVLNVFSHAILVIWAIMVVLPLLWAVMTSFKDETPSSVHPGRCPTSCISTTGRGPGRRRT